MAGTAFTDQRVKDKIAANFVPVLMDFDTEKKLVKLHGISSTPTVVYTQADLEAIEWTADVSPHAIVDVLLANMDGALEDIADGDDDELFPDDDDDDGMDEDGMDEDGEGHDDDDDDGR